MKPMLWTVLLALVALSAAPVEAKGKKRKNLLTNGSFEDKLDGWMMINNSGRAKAEITKKARKKGKRGLRIVKTGGVPADVLRCNVDAVAPGTRVKVSAQIRGKDVKNSWFKFFAYDEAGEICISDVNIQHITGSFSWKRFEKEFDLPKEAKSAAVLFMFVMGGEVAIDDVRVEGQGPVKAPKTQTKLDDEVRAWLDQNAVKLPRLDFDAPLDEFEPLKEILKDVRIVQLGEASHGDGTTFRSKARLARFLHEEMGFNVIAFESGLFECEDANRLFNKKSPRDVMFSSVPGVWRAQEAWPLFNYMAKTAKTKRPLRLSGFDCQSAGGGALERGERLGELLGEKRFPKALQERVREATDQIWNGKPLKKSEVKKLRVQLERVLARIVEEREKGAAEDRARELAFAERVVNDFFFWIGASRSSGGGRFDAINERDARMAENLRFLADTYYPDEKIITWGATFHFMHGAQGIHTGKKKHYEGCRQMGEIIHEAYADKVYTIGYVTHHGRAGMTFAKPYDIPEAPKGSLEDLLHAYGERRLFVDFRTEGPFHKRMLASPMGYSRNMTAVWPEVVDGVIFLDENQPASVVQR